MADYHPAIFNGDLHGFQVMHGKQSNSNTYLLGSFRSFIRHVLRQTTLLPLQNYFAVLWLVLLVCLLPLLLQGKKNARCMHMPEQLCRLVVT